jgi:hypothetical protein
MVSASTFALIFEVIAIGAFALLAIQAGFLFYFERFEPKDTGLKTKLDENFNYQRSHGLIMQRATIDKLDGSYMTTGVETLTRIESWKRQVRDYIDDFKVVSGNSDIFDMDSFKDNEPKGVVNSDVTDEEPKKPTVH